MQTNKERRAPIVVVMGHIDHGKSTLLDAIRHTNITEREAGGITQRVSCYEVEKEIDGENRKFTFIDTPGHEAFEAIRRRGSHIADIALLIISSTEGVRPQTLEAKKCISSDNIPYIVVATKIDRPEANIDRLKQSLAEHDMLIEEWGGNTPFIAVNSKSGENIDTLLELIALQADLEGLSGDPLAKATGVVMESSIDQKIGILATLLIKDGSVQVGNIIATATAYAPVRSILGVEGKTLSTASFSMPIVIGNWNRMPEVGAPFVCFVTKNEAIAHTLESDSIKVETFHEEAPSAQKYLNVVLQADNASSLEAVKGMVDKLGTEAMGAKIISSGLGAITDNDIKAAKIKGGIVIGFNVRVDKNAASLAEREKIEIRTFEIIYELIDAIESAVRSATPASKVEVETGQATVLKPFSHSKDRQLVGCHIESGIVNVGDNIKINRQDTIIGSGKIREMQKHKAQVSSVNAGEECGIIVESKTIIAREDTLISIS